VAAEQGCHRGLGDHLPHDDFSQRQDEVKRIGCKYKNNK
jgi:hypothetical protein